MTGTQTYATDPDRPHLGGYVYGGDPWTYYPDLWTYMADELDITSVLDVGCGEGHAVDFFRDLGVAAFGIDGIAQANPYIVEHDFTTQPVRVNGDFDAVWMCEFVEHIEERYLPNVMETISRVADTVFMTHALPGQEGYHHVNCRDDEYWKGVLAGYGYKFEADVTEKTRAVATHHYANSGLVFRRWKYIDAG